MSKHPAQPSSPRPSSKRTSSSPAVKQVDTTSPSEQAIAERAYQKFLARGCVHGSDLDDWNSAQQELAAELAQKRLSPGKKAS